MTCSARELKAYFYDYSDELQKQTSGDSFWLVAVSSHRVAHIKMIAYDTSKEEHFHSGFNNFPKIYWAFDNDHLISFAKSRVR